MKSFFKISLATSAISLLGTLPLGALTLTAFGLVLTNGVWGAMLFAFGAILSELFYVRITALPQFAIQKNWLKYLTPVLLFALVFMGLKLLIRDTSKVPDSSGFIRNFPLIAGIALSAINPLQVPFWLAWNTALKNKFHPSKGFTFLTPYMLGAGLGSFIGFLFVILIAWLFQSSLMSYLNLTNLIIGILYLGFAAWIGYRWISRHYKLIFSQA